MGQFRMAQAGLHPKPVFGQKAKRPSQKSYLEERVALYLEAHKLPRPVRQLRFAKEALQRQWKFDFAWPALGLALEVDGGSFMAKGAHNTGMKMMNDAQKYNAALLLGWRVFRVTDRMFRDGEAFTVVTRMLTTEIRYQSPVLTEAAL